MPTFSQLLKQYAERSGISDAELARAVGVRRQTIFRWKEGTLNALQFLILTHEGAKAILPAWPAS